MDIPKNSQRPSVRSKNPITSDPALIHLLEVAKGFESEVEFNGWKDSFLKVYHQYLDPAGAENAKASDGRLLRSMEKLAGTVMSVKALVEEGKITTDSQTVMGKRALTNMTDQMAKTEKEIARFMPTTGSEEQTVGYDKFELGAVLIEDGFHVYDLLKSTQAIVLHLQEQVLNDVLPNNKQSIIQFYLRQIQSFCDVMADLGLFGLMEDVIEMYKVNPRSKEKHVKAKPVVDDDQPRDFTKSESPLPKTSQDILPEEEPEIVELDPDKVYNFRTAFTGGYYDPFSGTAPGCDEEPVKATGKNMKDDAKGDGGAEDFLIYFDMKTGCIGKIARSICVSKSVIISANDAGEEVMDGEIEDDDEREKVLWEMKKAMKNKKKVDSKGTNGSKSSSSKSPGGLKSYVVTPKTGARRSVGGSKDADSAKGNLRGLTAPKLDKDDDEEDKSTKPSRRNEGNLGKSYSFDVKDMPGSGSSKRGIRDGDSMSSINYVDRKNGPAPSSDAGWVKPGLKKRFSDSVSNRASIQKVTKDPKPSNSGWTNASTMGASTGS